MKKRDRMALRRSIVNSIVDIVEDLVVSDRLSYWSPEESTRLDGLNFPKAPRPP